VEPREGRRDSRKVEQGCVTNRVRDPALGLNAWGVDWSERSHDRLAPSHPSWTSVPLNTTIRVFRLSRPFSPTSRSNVCVCFLSVKGSPLIPLCLRKTSGTTRLGHCLTRPRSNTDPCVVLLLLASLQIQLALSRSSIISRFSIPTLPQGPCASVPLRTPKFLTACHRFRIRLRPCTGSQCQIDQLTSALCWCAGPDCLARVHDAIVCLVHIVQGLVWPACGSLGNGPSKPESVSSSQFLSYFSPATPHSLFELSLTLDQPFPDFEHWMST
jgi:hypothetical protein